MWLFVARGCALWRGSGRMGHRDMEAQRGKERVGLPVGRVGSFCAGSGVAWFGALWHRLACRGELDSPRRTRSGGGMLRWEFELAKRVHFDAFWCMCTAGWDLRGARIAPHPSPLP